MINLPEFFLFFLSSFKSSSLSSACRKPSSIKLTNSELKILPWQKNAFYFKLINTNHFYLPLNLIRLMIILKNCVKRSNGEGTSEFKLVMFRMNLALSYFHWTFDCSLNLSQLNFNIARKLFMQMITIKTKYVPNAIFWIIIEKNGCVS